MFKKMVKQNRGFSLVELMGAIVVTSILLMGIYLAVNTTQKDSGAIERKVVAQADAKSALDVMALEIGMASYNADLYTQAWVNPAPTSTGGCTGLGNQNLQGIQIAAANAIVVQMDANDSCKTSSNCIADGANEVIRYNYVLDDGQKGHITRATNCGAEQPFLGDVVNAASLSPPRHRNVLVNNEELGISLFRYFDGKGDELIPGGTGLSDAQIPDIRRIVITLAVQTAEVDQFRGGQRRQLFYSTSVITRNHAIRSDGGPI